MGKAGKVKRGLVVLLALGQTPAQGLETDNECLRRICPKKLKKMFFAGGIFLS